MRSRATCGGTPKTAATAAEEAALALLARPGSWRWIGHAEPCGSSTWSPDSAQLGVGRRKPHSPQNQSSPGRCMTPPQDGQDQASSFHICPAATQITFGEEDAAHTTSGSSALATTTAFEAGQALAPVLGEHAGFGGAVQLVAGEVEQRDALRVGRLGDADEVLLVDLDDPVAGVRAARESRGDATAMLAPSALETTGPAALSASAISRVVVVLPLVAETRVTSRCPASSRRSGSSFSATRPPITEPLPRPAARDAAATALPAVTAILARGVSGSELPAISSRSSLPYAPRLKPVKPDGHVVWTSAYRDPFALPNRGTGHRFRRWAPAAGGHRDLTLTAMRQGSIPGAHGRVRPLGLLGDPVLHARCAEVTDFGPELAALVEDLFATMYAAHGVGLAANQVGEAVRVFVYDCPDDEDERHLGHVVNPGWWRPAVWWCAVRRAVCRCRVWRRGPSGTTRRW